MLYNSMLFLGEYFADNTFRRMSCILDQVCLYIKYGGLGVCTRKHFSQFPKYIQKHTIVLFSL